MREMEWVGEAHGGGDDVDWIACLCEQLPRALDALPLDPAPGSFSKFITKTMCKSRRGQVRFLRKIFNTPRTCKVSAHRVGCAPDTIIGRSLSCRVYVVSEQQRGFERILRQGKAVMSFTGG